jgi:hypothetical protein
MMGRSAAPAAAASPAGATAARPAGSPAARPLGARPPGQPAEEEARASG